jgi:hypothetical protein
MTTPTPKLTIDLACQSVLEFAELAPRVTGPRSLFTSAVVRQLDKDCGRRFDVAIVPYPVEKARSELEATIESYSDLMARSPRVAERLKALLEQGDQTDDVLAIAGLIRSARDVAGNVFGW